MQKLYAVLAVTLLVANRGEPSGTPDPPKLVLQITIDQLRGDLPLRYRDRFGEGGFRYLMEQGTWYESAQHPHAHTETIVGHTTLATGAYPSRHGMIANEWLELDSGPSPKTGADTPGDRVRTLAIGVHPQISHDSFTDLQDPDPIDHGVEDPRYTIIGTNRTGASPRKTLTTTIGDELTISNAGRAKVFGVSIKARAAVSMAGHTGKAFWFSSETGEFVSSTFYYDDYPKWVTFWNGLKQADSFDNKLWNLLKDRSSYLFR